jgi:PAS domain S-box-containing protein
MTSAAAMTIARSAIRRVLKPTVLPWLVLALGIPASFLLHRYFEASVENVARLRFEREANDARGVIESRLRSYSDVLYALRALFATDNATDRASFRRFVQSLDLNQRYRGFMSINYAAYVPASDRERFEQSVRRDTSLDPRGYPGFRIKPPGDRPEYFVLVYLEPMKNYEFAFGLDIGANPMADDPEKVADAVRLHRDTGRLISSAQPLRVRRARQVVYLAMRLAVYKSGMPVDTVEARRRAYIGSVGAAFDVEHLMREALDEGTLRNMQIRLYDAGPASDTPYADGPSERRLLFDSAQIADAPQPEAIAQDAQPFMYTVPVEIASRTWELEYRAQKNAVIGETDALLPRLILASGLVSSVLLFGVLYSLAFSRSRAERIANDMTRNLRESEASLGEAHALLNDAQKLAGVGCCHYEPRNGRIVWSDELYRIHGVDPDTFTPTYESTMSLVHPHDRAAWANALDHALHTGSGFESQFRIVRPDGSIRHLRSLGEVMHDASGAVTSMLWSVLDITEQKRTEGALRESAEQLTALSRRLVEVQEAERRQLSRELHDRVGQNLTALSINLDILRTSLSADAKERHGPRLSDSAALIESTADSIEDVMSELRPPMLDDYGLYPALNWYAQRFSERTGIAVDVIGSDNAERPAPEIEITLFRIAQEALNNVAKHAHAAHVRIALEHADKRCLMTVTDDGIGIAGTEAPQHRGLGMVTMRERTQAIGGRFTARTVPDGGTQIAIEVPGHDDTHTDRG